MVIENRLSSRVASSNDEIEIVWAVRLSMTAVCVGWLTSASNRRADMVGFSMFVWMLYMSGNVSDCQTWNWAEGSDTLLTCSNAI